MTTAAATVPGHLLIPAKHVRFPGTDVTLATDTAWPPAARVLGDGAFGKVLEMELNGTAVAVKELKPGAMDPGSIGEQRGAFFPHLQLACVAVRGGTAPTYRYGVDSLSMCADNEVAILSSLRPGPNVAQVFGVVTDAADRRVRIVMELCRHGSLSAFTKALVPEKVSLQLPSHFLHTSHSFVSHQCGLQFTAGVLLEVMEQLALGVKHLHHHRIIHRDIRCDNALVFSDSPLAVKIGDYGTSVAMGVDAYGQGTSRVPSVTFRA
jgi:serine/threonine protein kinase